MNIRNYAIVAALALGMSGPGQTTDIIVTSSFTGIWNQPNEESQGFVIQIVEQADGSREGVAYWFTYNEGEPFWLVGQGPVVDNRIDMEVFIVRGPDFLSPNDPALRMQELFGTASVTFDDCNNGTLQGSATKAVTGTGLGSVAITRLASVLGDRCTGGISDDLPAGQESVQLFVELLSTGLVLGSSGDAKFEISDDRTRFDVEIEDLPEGPYDLLVGGDVVGQIDVVADNNGTEGEIEFRSPADSGHPLLTFDPRDQLIDVRSTDGVVLSGMLGDVAPPGNPDLTGDDLEIKILLDNLGVFPEGEADAEFEERPDRAEFKVEVEDIPVGDYALRVGGNDVGTITVRQLDVGTEGEIEFRTPVEPGKQPLDFDPRGELVEILDAGTVLFSGTMPTAGNGGGDNGGGDGDDDASATEITVAFSNTGLVPAASGTAKLEIEVSRTKFEVEVEDLPDGTYDLTVGSTVVASFVVEDGESKVEFADPPENDELLLDFDPRGQSVSVSQGGTTFLQLDFPA